MSRLVLLIALFLTLQAGVSGAQPAASDLPPPGDDAVAAPGETPVIEPTPTPFEDYEASEQISEDLPVAFPVDI